jgi:hypothetical protein
MPEKKKSYDKVLFTPRVIKDAVEMLRKTITKDSYLAHFIYNVDLENESWKHSTEDEFFADYIKGFINVYFWNEYRNSKSHIAEGSIHISVDSFSNTSISVEMPNRADVEKVFYIFEANVEKCRLPKQPNKESNKSKKETDWISETIKKVEGRRPIAGRKLKLALSKLESEDVEEWQSAVMNIRDAWIELTKWLCKVKNIDTSDLQPDAVVDRLRKLKIDETDERLFNLARASFGLYSKHHKRDIDNDTATACVLSTIVSMQTVIREVFNAKR